MLQAFADGLLGAEGAEYRPLAIEVLGRVATCGQCCYDENAFVRALPHFCTIAVSVDRTWKPTVD